MANLDAPDETSDGLLLQLDQYLTAIQNDDFREQERLLDAEPRLSMWTHGLKVIDDFADVLSDPSLGQFGVVRQGTGVADQLANDLTIPPRSRGDEGGKPEAYPTAHASVTPAFGKYELRGEVGRGGMGVVYRAYQSDLDRTVALKMLNGSRFASVDQVRRFTQEAKLASRIRHPHIVTIYDVGEFAGQPYFTMEFIAGTSLADRLRDGPMPIEQAVQWLIVIAKAVGHLHSNGIVHRDLKPSNVLIDSEGQPCLVDFGLARSLSEFHDPTTTGTILGTPSYMSPEQAAGRVRETSERSDIYSLGAIFYEMLCGRPPFVADSPFDVILQVLEREPMPLRHWNREVPKKLEQICLRCLEKSADQRYSSAQEFASDLERWSLGDYPTFSTGTPVSRFRRTVRRHPAAAYRLLGLVPTLLIVLLRCLTHQAWGFYASIIIGLTFWSGLSVFWEWQSSKRGDQKWAPFAFTITDIVFLTMILQVQDSADIAHIIAYVLIILMAGLSLDRRLIWSAGIGSGAAYLCLVSLAKADKVIGWHIHVISLILLFCCTLVTDYQTRRLSIWIRRNGL